MVWAGSGVCAAAASANTQTSGDFMNQSYCVATQRVALLDAVTIQIAVEGADVNAAVGYRQAAPVIPRRDLVSTGPEFLSGLRVQRVEHGVGRAGNAAV